MNLKNLNDETLLKQTSVLARREREITLEILHHLKEIESRRLFSTLGCSSLFSYCVDKLGYSEGSAQRRIQAMRALRDLPQIERKIESGVLTLSNLAQAQTLFSHQKKSGQAYTNIEKVNFLEKLEGKTSRQAEKEIACENPASFKSEKVRPVAENANELKTCVDDEFLELLARLKGRLAHRYPSAKTEDVLKFAMKLALKQLDPTESKLTVKLAAIKAAQSSAKSPPPAPAVEQDKDSISRVSSLPKTQSASEVANQSKAIPQVNKQASSTQNRSVKRFLIPSRPSSASKREVWSRADGKCENCGSRYALEIDHQIPKALGGSHDIRNLRLLCRACNQRAAIEKIGRRKMSRYFV